MANPPDINVKHVDVAQAPTAGPTYSLGEPLIVQQAQTNTAQLSPLQRLQEAAKQAAALPKLENPRYPFRAVDDGRDVFNVTGQDGKVTKYVAWADQQGNLMLVRPEDANAAIRANANYPVSPEMRADLARRRSEGGIIRADGTADIGTLAARRVMTELKPGWLDANGNAVDINAEMAKRNLERLHVESFKDENGQEKFRITDQTNTAQGFFDKGKFKASDVITPADSRNSQMPYREGNVSTITDRTYAAAVAEHQDVMHANVTSSRTTAVPLNQSDIAGIKIFQPPQAATSAPAAVLAQSATGGTAYAPPSVVVQQPPRTQPLPSSPAATGRARDAENALYRDVRNIYALIESTPPRAFEKKLEQIAGRDQEYADALSRAYSSRSGGSPRGSTQIDDIHQKRLDNIRGFKKPDAEVGPNLPATPARNQGGSNSAIQKPPAPPEPAQGPPAPLSTAPATPAAQAGKPYVRGQSAQALQEQMARGDAAPKPPSSVAPFHVEPPPRASGSYTDLVGKAGTAYGITQNAIEAMRVNGVLNEDSLVRIEGRLSNTDREAGPLYMAIIKKYNNEESVQKLQTPGDPIQREISDAMRAVNNERMNELKKMEPSAPGKPQASNETPDDVVGGGIKRTADLTGQFGLADQGKVLPPEMAASMREDIAELAGNLVKQPAQQIFKI